MPKSAKGSKIIRTEQGDYRSYSEGKGNVLGTEAATHEVLRIPISLSVEHLASLEATMVTWELDSNADETSIDTDIETIFKTVNNHGGLYCSPLYGGPGGSFWNDGTYSGIRRITVIVNDRTLTALQLDYGVEGDINVKDRDFRGVHHGGQGGTKIVYDLNYPEEFVTKISGYYGPIWFWFQTWSIVKSLTFHTNQRKLGPCGPEHGTYFETESEGKIVGMHGFGSCVYVDSVGVYMRKL